MGWSDILLHHPQGELGLAASMSNMAGAQVSRHRPGSEQALSPPLLPQTCGHGPQKQDLLVVREALWPRVTNFLPVAHQESGGHYDPLL
jgi:hypothetical protein